MKKIICGECFSYANKKALDLDMEGEEATVVHGTVTHPWDNNSYEHAWVEHGDKVYDWQTMVAHSSKYAGNGWPREAFYNIWKPINTISYTPLEATRMMIKTKSHGPWTEEEREKNLKRPITHIVTT